MRLRVCSSLALLVIWLAACGPAPSTETGQAGAGLTLTDCVLAAAGGAGQVDARCGTLAVPEDRARTDGRQINLRVAVVPAVSRSPRPDPLFLLAGGPGQAATEAFPAMLAAFEEVNQTRDIVLVDQRGTGRSNPLRCLDPDDETVMDEADVIAALQACPARLEADLRLYTTEIAMQDLDAVRAALGYEQVNLYGASYGTRAALTYLRLHPDRVRTMILDSVVDADFRLLLDASQDGQRALELAFGRCQADAACRDAFPEVAGEFAALLERLEAQPVDLEIANPVTGKPLAFTLTRAILTNIIFGALYAPEFVALLPLTVHTAYTDGNYGPLVAQAISLDAGLYDGMFYAVACAEDAPFITAAEAATAAGPIFGDRTAALRAVCAAWPQGAVSADFRAPVSSAVPTLLLSGEADPITPPKYAEAVARHLPDSLHVVAPGMGHGILIRGCVDRLATDFITLGSLQGLDPACAQAIQPPPFFVSFTGPQP
jgi:pimeloyl-ACP methyl ester carboxylesterase